MKAGLRGIGRKWHLRPGLVALMVLLSATSWAPAAAQDEDLRADARPWVDPGPAVVSLKGFLVNKRYYGPPGHGENPAEDRKLDGWLLLLVTPIDIRANAEDETSETQDVRQVQLVVIGRERQHLFKKLRKLLGQEVYATGMLYEGRTGWYWVLTSLELLDISPVPRDTRGADLEW